MIPIRVSHGVTINMKWYNFNQLNCYGVVTLSTEYSVNPTRVLLGGSSKEYTCVVDCVRFIVIRNIDIDVTIFDGRSTFKYFSPTGGMHITPLGRMS
jgi:hypothetical protein